MKQREFLVISITVFLTIVAWILADLRHIATTNQVKADPIVEEEIEFSINPALFEILGSKR